MSAKRMLRLHLGLLVAVTSVAVGNLAIRSANAQPACEQRCALEFIDEDQPCFYCDFAQRSFIECIPSDDCSFCDELACGDFQLRAAGLLANKPVLAACALAATTPAIDFKAIASTTNNLQPKR